MRRAGPCWMTAGSTDASGDQPTHGGKHDFGLAHDHRRRRTYDRVTTGGEGKVPSTILLLGLPPCVELSAVALDHQPAVDDEIHPSHSIDPHLDVEPAAEPPEHQAHQRLRSRFRSPVEQSPDGAVTKRQQGEDLPDLTGADESS